MLEKVLVIPILYNIALLLVLSIFFATYPFKDLDRLNTHKILIGVIIGVVGILGMLSPLKLQGGVIVDSRTILLGVSGMAFGAIPTTIGAVILLIFRFSLGGGGLVTATLTILSSSLLGIVWHIKRFDVIIERGTHPNIEYYGMGVLIHVMMLLFFFFLPSSMRVSAIKGTTLPILLFYPVGFYLLSLLFFGQIFRILTTSETKKSERLFKTMFREAPIGMALTDITSGTIKEMNQYYLDMLGYTKEELIGRRWSELTHPDDIAISEEVGVTMNRGEFQPINLDKRLISKDGREIWINLSIAPFTSPDMEKNEALEMALDVSERKYHEEEILRASNRDALTGLYNRVHFEALVKILEERRDRRIIVVIVDVNGLKILNEAFGREEGNRLLVQIADTLKARLPAGDYAHRVGGDEYALLFFDKEVDQVETLLEAISQEIAMIDIMGSVSPSISWGLYDIDWENGSMNDAIKEAELALASRKIIDSPNMRGKAVYAIINTLHEKNKREELHSRRVSELCERLAKAYGMGEKASSELRLVGLLHDIGKIAIDEAILNKREDLNREQWRQMKRHSEIGYRLLSSVEDMAGFAHYVLYHHERWDGSGYPKGLRGEEIPLASRIITIADAYDAMTAERTYRKPISTHEAAAELKRYSATQFDPTLARLFVEEVLDLNWEEL